MGQTIPIKWGQCPPLYRWPLRSLPPQPHRWPVAPESKFDVPSEQRGWQVQQSTEATFLEGGEQLNTTLQGIFDKPSALKKFEDVVLGELESLRKAQDEPDFMQDAYNLAKETIKSAYTHYIGSAPTPAAAPDGDGGVVVEWKSGKREVRLISAHSKNGKSYIYSRGKKTAKVDYEVSGAILAEVVRKTFAD
jgi:hypothetical protein